MDRLKVLVSGMVAADPHQGGATWAVLQYLIGLRALGHAVSFVEPISREKLKPGGASLAESTNARYFDAVIEHYSLSDHGAALLVAGSQKNSWLHLQKASQDRGGGGSAHQHLRSAHG